MRKNEKPHAPVLLIQSGYDLSVTRDPTSEPPIGLGGIASYLSAKGMEADLFDFQIQGEEELARRIGDPGLRLAAFSAASLQIYRAERFAKKLKSLRPDVKTIIGGIHASAMPEDTARKFGTFDFVGAGEGETIIFALASALLENRGAEEIPGVGWMEDGRFCFKGPADLIDDLDSLPHPDRSLMHIDRYVPNFSAYRGRPASGVLTSRGCPYRCRYCSVRKLYGGKFRTHGARWVVEELKICLRDHGIRDIWFYDDTFNAPRGRVNTICEEILKEGFALSWTCYARADDLDGPAMDLMKRAGCFQLRFGIEVGSDERLEDLGKKRMSLESVRTAVREARKAGLETYSNFMLGLPGETEQEAWKTIGFARSLVLDSFSFNTFYPYPGAAYTDELAAKGRLSPFLGLYPEFDLEGLFIGYQRDPSTNSVEDAAHRRRFESLVKKRFILCAMHPRWLGRKSVQAVRRPIATWRFFTVAVWRFVHRFVIGTKTR